MHNVRDYIITLIMPIKYQINSCKPIQQSFIFLLDCPLICSNRALTSTCILAWHDLLYYSNRVLIYCKYVRSYWIILRVT